MMLHSDSSARIRSVSEEAWLRMGLPALIVSKRNLRELLEKAGQSATLELAELGEVSADALGDVSSDALLGAKISAPGLSISFGATAMSTLLTFEDDDEVSSVAESLLETLEPCRRRLAALTHGDAAIAAGLMLPLAAGLLAPESSVKLACLVASALWLLYLLRVQSNAQHRWCVFTDEL